MPTHDLKAGDRIILDGYPPRVPMRLAGTRATVERIGWRGGITVRCDEDAYGFRRIKPRDVRRVLRGDKWVIPPWKEWKLDESFAAP